MLANKEVVERVRQKFLKSYETNRALYHENDIKNILENDWPIERFVLVNSNEEKAVKAVIKAMQWRKSFGINDFNDQSFPYEIYKINAVVRHGYDKEDRPLVWFNCRNQQKYGELETLMTQFFMYQYEKVDRQTSNQGWIYICDFSDSGLSNLDISFGNFLTEMLQNYYPRALKYIINVEMPWIMNAASKVWLAFINEETKSVVKIIKKEELTDYLTKDVIPVHLGGTNANVIAYEIPSGVKRLDQMSDFGFTGKQIEKIYSTFKCLKQ